MATSNKNAKSQLFTVRVPHEVVAEMESLKDDGESSAGFIVTSLRVRSNAASVKRPRKPTRSDTQYLGNGRNYGISPGYAALQYTQHADPVLPRFGEMGYAPMPYTLHNPISG